MNNFYSGRQVMVTGGLGFIGSNLAIRLAERGARVIVVDSGLEGCGANLQNIAVARDRIEWIRADLGQPHAFRDELRHTQLIFNVAGEISHWRSMQDPERDLQINTIAHLQFLLACRDARPGTRVVYASTRQVYGKPNVLPVDEAQPIQPVDFNGIHKYATGHYHLLLSRRGDLDCCILRLSNVYGPRMALHLPQQGFLGVYLRAALLGEPIHVYGDGAQLRDPVFIDDVVNAFLAAGALEELPSRIYNVGGPQSLTVRQIAEFVANASDGSELLLQPFPTHLKTIDIGSYASDSSRLARELGVYPRVAFPEGIAATLAYYRQHMAAYLTPEPLQV